MGFNEKLIRNNPAVVKANLSRIPAHLAGAGRLNDPRPSV